MPKTCYLIAVLILLAMFPPFATDMYLPAFKNIELTFSTNFQTVQLSLSLFLIGYAVAQLIFGPLSDRYGRKPILLTGIAIFIIFSLLCEFAQTIHWFYGARLLQAIGAGSGAVISFAIIKDLYQHEERIRYIGIISAVMGLAPIIAPIIGGYLVTWLNWRVIFLFLTIMGLVAFISICCIKESISRKSKVNVKTLYENYLELVNNLKFICAVLSCAFGFSAMFSFIAGSPKIYIQVFEISQAKFGYFFAINAFAFMTGNFLTAKYSKKRASLSLNKMGALIIIIGGILLLISSLLIHGIVPIVVSMLIATLGVGMVVPSAIANAMSHIKHYAGQASSLIAFLQFGMAAIITIIVGQLSFINAVPLGILVTVCGILSTLVIYIR